MMTTKEVRERVDAIRAMIDDDEVAHGAEDRLHEDVLDAIANGAENAVELAAEALKTREIDFARWCA